VLDSVDSGLRDINGRRAIQSDRKLRNQRVKDGFHLLPLGEIRASTTQDSSIKPQMTFQERIAMERRRKERELSLF